MFATVIKAHCGHLRRKTRLFADEIDTVLERCSTSSVSGEGGANDEDGDRDDSNGEAGKSNGEVVGENDTADVCCAHPSAFSHFHASYDCLVSQDHVAAVYGAKQVSSLIEIDTVLKHRSKDSSSASGEDQTEGDDGKADGEDSQPNGEADANGTGGIHLAGFISSAEWRRGRSSADRQHFFINRRPVELPKVQRAINEGVCVCGV